MVNGALPHGPSYRAHPRLYLFVESLQCTNSGAIEGTADMPRTRRAYQSDVNDPGCVKTLQSRECGEWYFSDQLKLAAMRIRATNSPL